MPIAKSNGAVVGQTSVAETAPAPVAGSLGLGKRVLETPKAEENRKEYKQPYQGRDFEAEARGKVACVAFNAALASPGIAGLQFTNIDEYLALVRKAADASVAYTWEKQK
jgi:hypothetical protein